MGVQSTLARKETCEKIFVNEEAAAAALSVSCSFLQKDRRTKRTIPFVKIGDRVVYDIARVREVLHARMEGGESPRGKGAKRK
jgi:hypothetical protein